MHPDTKSPVPISLDAPKWFLDTSEQRRITDAALAHTDRDLVARPMWKHVLAGFMLVLCACGAAAGCWRVDR